MTILQLKYVLEVARSASMRKAASKLYVSQPALSTSIRDLEDELNVKIFERSNKGIILTDAGHEFVSFAKRAVTQFELIEDRYLYTDKDKSRFSVSMQHYVFAIHAFVAALQKNPEEKYIYSVHETKTEEVLDDVRFLKSEIGVVSYSSTSEKLMKKLFREYNLIFTPLMVKETYAYVKKNHPLANEKIVSLDMLKDYPCVSFDQSSEKEFYISEEALGDYNYDKLIKSNDRATSAELLVKLNGYSIGTGIMMESSAIKDVFVAIKLKEEDPLTIGYITKQNHKMSKIGDIYIEELKKYKEV